MDNIWCLRFTLEKTLICILFEWGYMSVGYNENALKTVEITYQCLKCSDIVEILLCISNKNKTDSSSSNVTFYQANLLLELKISTYTRCIYTDININPIVYWLENMIWLTSKNVLQMAKNCWHFVILLFIFFSGNLDSIIKGRPIAPTNSSLSKNGPLLTVRQCSDHSTSVNVCIDGPLARLYLVQFRQVWSTKQSQILESR